MCIVQSGTGLVHCQLPLGTRDTAELGRGRAGVALEDPREVALVGEARGQREVCQRSIGTGELAADKFYAQAAQVVADRTMVVPAKHRRQVTGMNAERPR